MAHPDRHFSGRQGVQDYLIMQNQPTTSEAAQTGDEEQIAELDEPPDEEIWRSNSLRRSTNGQFQKTVVAAQAEPKESLLTRALLTKSNLNSIQQWIHPPSVGPSRRISTWSDCSVTSTADLTSDGGCTSPTRTGSRRRHW